MTVTRGFALFLTIAVAGTLLQASGPGGESAAPTVRLKAISARVSAKGASLVVEASEPVAYLATRPDPLTLLLDFRNVGADGITNAVAADDREPDCRRDRRVRRIARRARVAHPCGARATRRAPRPKRSQHGRHRLRQAGRDGRVLRAAAGGPRDGRAGRDDGARNRAAGRRSSIPWPSSDSAPRSAAGRPRRRRRPGPPRLPAAATAGYPGAAAARPNRCSRPAARARAGSSREIPSASIFRARICEPCSGRSPRSAA